MNLTPEQRRLFDALHEDKVQDYKVFSKRDYGRLFSSLIDKYPESAHFVYELLQNAEDANATQVSIILKNDRLIFVHNGTKHFDVTPLDSDKIGDINSITGFGFSSKAPEPQIEQTIIPLVYPEYKPGRIPLYTLRAACGYFGEGRLPEEEGWVDATGLGFTPDPKRHFAVHAKGDSMLPKIHDGDICIFEWYTGGSRDGEIVLSQISEFDDAYDGRYTIKHYQSTKKYDEYGNWEHASIQLQPLNPDFNPIDINEFEEVPVIGIFKCVLN